MSFKCISYLILREISNIYISLINTLRKYPLTYIILCNSFFLYFQFMTHKIKSYSL